MGWIRRYDMADPTERPVGLDLARDAVRRGELVVLPETATTGFTPDCSTEELWDLVSEIPGPVTEPVQQVARDLGVHVCVGTYERGPERGTVYNASVLIAPSGEVDHRPEIRTASSLNHRKNSAP